MQGGNCSIHLPDSKLEMVPKSIPRYVPSTSAILLFLTTIVETNGRPFPFWLLHMLDIAEQLESCLVSDYQARSIADLSFDNDSVMSFLDEA